MKNNQLQGRCCWSNEQLDEQLDTCRRELQQQFETQVAELKDQLEELGMERQQLENQCVAQLQQLARAYQLLHQGRDETASVINAELIACREERDELQRLCEVLQLQHLRGLPQCE